MAEVAFWEKRFVETYIIKSKRDRYLSLLKGRKHRNKILERLNHALDYDPQKATVLDSRYEAPEALLRYLNEKHLPATCHLMADGNQLDGRELRLEFAVGELLGNHFGALIICPPKPIVIYKEEDIGNLILLA